MNGRTIRLDEINFHGLLVTVIQNLWVVLCICLSTVMLFTSCCKMDYSPRYTSSATLMVGAKDSTSAYNSLTTTQSMAAVFSEVFQSNVLRDKVRQQIGEEYDGVVTTNIIPETNLLTVSVTSSSPEMSFRGLGLIIENHNSISEYLFANAQLEVIKDPVVPVIPSNPLNYQKHYSVLVLLSCGATLLLIVLLCVFRDSVQTPAAARRRLDAQLLRTIHHERNKNASVFCRKKEAPLINAPLISRSFVEDNMGLCSAVEYHMRKYGQKVIVVTSAGENEGKSTISSNLALALAAKGKRVVLLDCDFRKPSLHKIFKMQVKADGSFSAGLLNKSADVLAGIVETKTPGLSIGFSQIEHKHVSVLLNNGRLRQTIEHLRKTVDYVVLDTPPMLVAADTETVGRLADTAMLVVRGDFMITTTVNDCLDKLRAAAPEVCGVVLNNYHGKLF